MQTFLCPTSLLIIPKLSFLFFLLLACASGLSITNTALFGVICPVVNIHQHPDRKTVRTWFFVPIPPHMGNKVKNRMQRQMMKDKRKK